MLKLKDKVLKIILIISSLPFIGVLLNGIYAAFYGVSIGFFGDFSKIYGFDAFIMSIASTSIEIFMTGVVPVCLIYQIFYLIRHFIKKKKLKEKEVDS